MSRPARARGLKQMLHVGLEISGVAPRTGAWIETSPCAFFTPASVVAPRTGAWIETRTLNIIAVLDPGRAPHGRVD